jgi:DNA gyrase subunit A
MQENDKIILRGIEAEMRTAYIDYSMSVIVSRALPDVRDGLKPVHRRVLYGMSDLGLASNRPYKKSARIVGEVLGKYHPHGDGAVYDTMVRMAQPWSLRYPLVDGQGNFGSVDGDPPAAMRYTEARLRALAEQMLADIDKDTVDFAPNFDDSLTEPKVLPSAIPNLLVNGSSGIAVGMATNMAPHNLREVVAAIIAYIDDNAIELPALMKHIPAPDFPTGGIIYGTSGVHEAYATGRGRVVLRGKAVIENISKDREAIIITEIPYQVNKALLAKKIDDLAGEKKIEGISVVRDESSDRGGMRLVVELRRDAVANVVLNNLYKHTELQQAFHINNVALVAGRPLILNLKDQIRHYVDHRHEVVGRRTAYELAEARQRANILLGLSIAVSQLDKVIALIRSSANPEEAKLRLIDEYLRAGNLSIRDGNSPIKLFAKPEDLFDQSLTDETRLEIQAKAILDMRLQRLTGLEIDKIEVEFKEIQERIADLASILASDERQLSIVRTELLEVARRFGDDRRTAIEITAEDFTMEDMIANEQVVITISTQGYIKRTPLTEYRSQKRGGTGARGTGTKEEDAIEHLYIASTHNYLLFFTEGGRCHWLKVFELPEGSRTTKGRAIQNLLQIEPGDRVRAYVTVPKFSEEFLEGRSILMVTEKGVVKKTELEAYSRPRAAGINAINIAEGDRLVSAALVTDKVEATETREAREASEIVIATSKGLANRFEVGDVRDMGRTATGVRGIRLSDAEDDIVIGMVVADRLDAQLLVVSEHGYGKRSELEEYRKTNRGSKGVRTLNVTEKTGKLLAIVEANDAHDLMIITREGILIRMPVKDIRLMGRNAQGVRLIKLRDDDGIAAVTKLEVAEAEPIDTPTDEASNGSAMEADVLNEDVNEDESNEANNSAELPDSHADDPDAAE